MPQEISCFCHYLLNYQGKLLYDAYTKYRPSLIPTGGLDIPILLILKKNADERDIKVINNFWVFLLQKHITFVKIIKVILEFVYFSHVFK